MVKVARFTLAAWQQEFLQTTGNGEAQASSGAPKRVFSRSQLSGHPKAGLIYAGTAPFFDPGLHIISFLILSTNI